MALLMQSYGDSSDDEPEGPPRDTPEGQPTAGAAASSSKGTSFRKMEPGAKAEYHHGLYEARKEKGMKLWLARYLWLKSSPLYGWHCSLCIKATHKAGDKLATTGYGFIGEGDTREMVLVPSSTRSPRSATYGLVTCARLR